MVYELKLHDKGKYITAKLSADSVEQLAHLVLSLFPTATLESCRELRTR